MFEFCGPRQHETATKCSATCVAKSDTVPARMLVLEWTRKRELQPRGPEESRISQPSVSTRENVSSLCCVSTSGRSTTAPAERVLRASVEWLDRLDEFEDHCLSAYRARGRVLFSE
jgi:hypothetical protein